VQLREGFTAITVSESGNHAAQTYNRTTSGGGNYLEITITGTRILGTNAYTLVEAGDARAGHFSQTKYGTDRYGLLPLFNDVSNAVSGASPGNVTFHSHGLPFRDPSFADMVISVGVASMQGLSCGTACGAKSEIPVAFLAPGCSTGEVMSQVSHTLSSFQCGKHRITIDAYYVWATGIYSYPQWRLHPKRIRMESFATDFAQKVFGKFPVSMLWPEGTNKQTDKLLFFSGVQVFANCTSVPSVSAEPDVVEKLLVIWFQKDHLVIPDPVILPRLQKLSWQTLAETIAYDD
jgi:hypothetical protein